MAEGTGRLRASRITAEAWESSGESLMPRLLAHPAVQVRGAATAEEAGSMAARVLTARDRWIPDFGGEQFALGRAFYTHLETGRMKDYFAGAAASDALVEEVLPGVAARTLALLARRSAGRCAGGLASAAPGSTCSPRGGRWPARAASCTSTWKGSRTTRRSWAPRR